MASKNRSETTRLNEVQARALADWWGGRYEQKLNPEKSGEIWHGAVFWEIDREALLAPVRPELEVFSLEEARALENFRDAVNPGAPDWVG